MPETKVFSSKVDNRAAQAGQAIGQGVAQGLEEKLMHMANMKAEKVRAGHLKTLYPDASEAQLRALAALGPQAEQQFYKGVSAVQQTPTQTQQIPGSFEPNVNFGGNLQSNIGNGQNSFNSQEVDQLTPMDKMNALGAIGLRMSPQQEQQFQRFSPEQQEKMVEDVYDKLPPKYQRQMEDFYNNALAKDLGKPQQQGMVSQPQPQQVIGSPQPGVGPQQATQQLDVGRALAEGNNKNVNKVTTVAENKRQQDLNLKIEATNEIEDSLKDIEELVNSGDIQTGFIAQKAAEAGFLSQLTPDTAQLYQAMQDLLVKQQVAASMGGRGSNEFRKTIASAKLNLAQPLPVIKKTLEKIKKANVQYRKSLETIRSGGQIEERNPLQSQSTSKPSNVVKSLDQAKVKDGARAKNLDTGEWFVFKNGNWEAE